MQSLIAAAARDKEEIVMTSKKGKINSLKKRYIDC